MERLTQFISGHYWYNTEDMNVGDKLGQLEDVIEKYGIESVKELDEILENAIVPKFKIGQEVFYYDVDVKKIIKAKVTGFSFCDDFENLFYELYGVSYFTRYNIIEENRIFATEEEARKRLEELNGE